MRKFKILDRIRAQGNSNKDAVTKEMGKHARKANGKKAWKAVTALSAACLCAVIVFAVVQSALAATILTISGSTVLSDTFTGGLYSTNMNYNNYTAGNITTSGLTAATFAKEQDSGDVYEYTYFTLPTSRSASTWIRFSRAYRYINDNGSYSYYDVKIYLWAPAYDTNSSYNNDARDTGVVEWRSSVNGESYNGAFSFTSMNFLTKDGAGKSYCTVQSEWHFYEPGTETEVSVNGILYFDDNDTNEGWCCKQGLVNYYAYEGHTLVSNTNVESGYEYILGTVSNDQDISSRLYMTFTSTPSSPLTLSYFGHRTGSAPKSAYSSYTVKFDGNGASGGSMDSTKMALWTLAALPDCTYYRSGYLAVDGDTGENSGWVFAGWNTKADGSGTSYADGASVANLGDGSDTITLYAQWERAEGNWDLTEVLSDTKMFYGDSKLKGGAGTGYSSAHTDSDYAQIDGGADDPGYFTNK